MQHTHTFADLFPDILLYKCWIPILSRLKCKYPDVGFSFWELGSPLGLAVVVVGVVVVALYDGDVC